MRVCYLDCHEAGMCCYLLTLIDNLIRPLELFYLRMRPIHWRSLELRLAEPVWKTHICQKCFGLVRWIRNGSRARKCNSGEKETLLKQTKNEIVGISKFNRVKCVLLLTFFSLWKQKQNHCIVYFELLAFRKLGFAIRDTPRVDYYPHFVMNPIVFFFFRFSWHVSSA
jgi:hypothetical protein